MDMDASPSTFEIVGSHGRDLDAIVHSMLGLRALVREMADQGIDADTLLRGSGVQARQLGDSEARMSNAQKISILRNAQRLSRHPDVGLRAGARQQLGDFGIYGYATASCATIGDAIIVGMKHLKLVGPVLEKRFRLEGRLAKFEGRDVMDLGDLLPLATEFWIGTTLSLASCVLGAPFPSRSLKLPYPRPAHGDAYAAMFECEVRFDAGTLEWSFDAELLRRPCPQANAYAADQCRRVCEKLQHNAGEGGGLAQHVRMACLGGRGQMPGAEQFAERFGLSVRTLHRRLADEGVRFQELVDEARLELSTDLLRSTRLTIDEVALRTGFSEAANFRRAFRKWTGLAPAAYRARHAG
jgi:AraC-like DNA-binding protein